MLNTLSHYISYLTSKITQPCLTNFDTLDSNILRTLVGQCTQTVLEIARESKCQRCCSASRRIQKTDSAGVIRALNQCLILHRSNMKT